MNAATRILSPTGIITSEDRSQVLEHAAEILAYMRGHPRDESCSPECGSVQGVLAAALLCMSDDVAKLDAAIAELRRLSGLTWDQLARLFSVSRRALHFWASGKPMMPTNEEHLQRLLSVLRKIDRGSASANRRELLAAREDSAIALDLLQERQYDAVVSLISTTTAVTRISTPKLAPQALALRTPPPPEKLIDALQDRIHQDLGTVRIAKSVRVKRDG